MSTTPPNSADDLAERSRTRNDRRVLSATQKRLRIDAAVGYLVLGMPAAAIRELDEFHDELLPQVMRIRGEAYREQEQHDHALREFEQLLNVQPDDLSAVIGKAWCLKRIDRLPEAIEALRDAVVSHPQEALIQYNLACYFSLAGDLPRCLTHLGRALRMDAHYGDMIADEPDFDGVRSEDAFQTLLKSAAVSGTESS